MTNTEGFLRSLFGVTRFSIVPLALAIDIEIRLIFCTGTTYLRNAGKGGTGGGKCGKGPILGGFAAGRPRYKGGMSQLF